MQMFEFKFPVTVKTRDGGMIPFDPAHDGTHRALLDRQISQWKTVTPAAKDAELDYIDMEHHVAKLVDRTVTTVDTEAGRQIVSLAPADQKTTAGDRIARVWEQRLGLNMTRFEPYEGRAVFERLTADQARARLMLADAWGIKPWDVQVSPRADGGWHCRLAPSIVFKPSKMDAATRQAAISIGRYGWTYEADAKHGVVDIIPGEPPTFLKTHPYPFDRLGDPADRDRTPFGVKLPARGGDHAVWEPACIDWTESSFVLVGGEGGSGKSVLVNGMLASLIAQRPELSIIDLSNKATDYYWCRPWVTPGHWGCESIVQAAGVLNRLVDEIEHGERAQVWKRNAWQNWLDIPKWAKQRYPLHYIVIDEYSSLVDEAQTVRSIPNPEKTLPAVFGSLFTGQAENDIKTRTLRLLRTARAQGYRLILISQTINDKSGLGPTTRDLFGQRIAMGPNPSESLMKGVFHDLASLPEIPENLAVEGVTKGVGRAEFTGQPSCVFKTCYAGDSQYSDTYRLAQALIERIGVPDGVDATRFLKLLEPHGEDDPVDAEYMHEMTSRIDLPYGKALESDPILVALKQSWEESKAGYETPSPMPAGDEPETADGPVSSGRPAVEVDSSGPVMDARMLESLMRG
ncbi:FtsK/SpoIIIE domain-containing protein [Bifidobacterium animalis]|uniref:FtsK/SpoIIIE domain-containing protein n=1 Tax=Bifidobacterium animalis TaxID=28025 RepID=UPI002149C8B4|nr:FtsK/SpoIIIE domain-containing protein [Bifidobacterium animalis]MCR1995041.1 FtsK/SpoIIIE domain-containing protein [Bifidobacterium animalis subsp. animalis]